MTFFLCNLLVLFYRLALVILIFIRYEEPICKSVFCRVSLANLVRVVRLIRIMVSANNIKAVEFVHRITLCEGNGTWVWLESYLRHSLVDTKNVLVRLYGVLVLAVVSIELSFHHCVLFCIGNRVVIDAVVAKDGIPSLMSMCHGEQIVIWMIMDVS